MLKKIYRVFVGVVTLLLPVVSMGQAPALSNVRCNPNGTLASGTDDYIQFSILPTPPVASFQAPYTYSVTATQGGNAVAVTKQDGSAATNLLYYDAYAAPLRLANGTSGNGNVFITVTPNWGGYPASTVILTDPGSCSTSGACGTTPKTVTYTYESYRDRTEAVNWATAIPKFDATGGKTLTGVSVSMEGLTWNRTLLENSASGPQQFRARSITNYEFSLNGSTISMSPNQTIEQTGGVITVGAKVSVPASGAWTGDVAFGSNTYTTRGMDTYNDWINQTMVSGQDMLSDSRWVTNLTGNPTHDDDIFLSPLHHNSNTGVQSYTSGSPEFASFLGTGTVPLTYTSINEFEATGGGGNVSYRIRTTTSSKITVTYTYTEDCSSLPVTLLFFNATRKNDQAVLQWSTSYEKSFKGFGVERSADLTNWTEIGFIGSVSDGGTKNGRTNYTYTDEGPLTGANYYRLKQVDVDNTFEYSAAKAVKFSDVSVSVYPNPASDYLGVKGLTGSEQISIYNTKGMLVRKVNNATEGTKVSLSGITEGIYFVRVTSVDGTTVSHKVVVTK